jgi:hypothetical protein
MHGGAVIQQKWVEESKRKDRRKSTWN